MSFAPKPAYRPWDRAQQIGIMLDEPFNFGKTVGENVLQGVMDSYGLGTAIRDAMTPQGNLGERLDASGRGRPMFDPFNMLESDQISMTPDEYQSSKYYRKDVPWDHGLTEDRAAALAEFSDTRAMRAHYSEKQPVAAFLGQLVGQAFDPINYIPVFGEAAQAAAIAKAGSVGGRMLLGASEAAINTAAFGVLTADIRGKLGDDVSFASIVNEVATSALIGGVFGGGIGVLSRGGDVRRRLAEAKVRDGLDSMATTQRAMIPLGEAATSLADTGVAKLSVNGMSTIERMRAESATRDVTGRVLETETAGVTGNKAGEVVISPSGFKVNVRPEVVDISTLTPATGALQVRNRNSAASAAQVEQIATGLEPARLMPAIAADQGAPLVGDDNIIDSGNGRVLALRRAYEAYPEKAAAYRAALTEAGYDVTGIANPVLISRRVTPLSPDARAQFNADANSSSTARMSAVEIAEMDRAALNDGVLNALDDGPIAAPANRAFVARFLGELPPNERGALVDKAGNLNADGVRRLENALVASAYGDVDADVLRRFAEATDDNTRAIVGAMSDVAGPWARMRRAIRTGEVDPEFDTTPELTQALRMLGGWRDQAAREGRPVSVVIREGMAQMDLLGGAITPEAQIFVRMFYQTDAFAKAVGRDTLAARLNRVINSTLELGKPQLFGDALPVTKGEVLKNAANDLETDLFAPDSVERGAEGIGQGGERSSAGANREGDRPGTGENAGDAGRAEAVAEDDGTAKAGDTILVYRLGAAGGDLAGRNGGNALAVARHWQNVQDGPRSAAGVGDTVTAYEVTLTKDPDAAYSAIINDKGNEAAAVGRLKKGGQLKYSFPSDGAGFTSRPVASFPLSDIEAHLNGRGLDGSLPDFLSDVQVATSLSAVADARRATQPAAERITATSDLIASQPARTLDELYAVAPAHQEALGTIGAELGERYGAEWKDPGIKDKAGAAEKMTRKRYDSTKRLTDVVRGGFVVKGPEAADAIIADLGKRFTVVDEGWRITAAGYFDRKAMVQFEDGTIGEVQFWHPDMLDAKKSGHDLYEEMRKLPDGDPRYEALLLEQREIYLKTLDTAGDEWLPVISQLSDELVALGRPASGKAASNADSVKTVPESTTSSNRTDSQAPPSETMAQAELPLNTAGRDSQSMNVSAMRGNMDTPPTVVNTTEPAPDPVPEGLDAAEARVGRPDSVKELAEQFGVDEAGGYVEQGDIDRLRALGRLSPEEEAALKAADDAYADAESYAETLNYIAATCGVRG